MSTLTRRVGHRRSDISANQRSSAVQSSAASAFLGGKPVRLLARHYGFTVEELDFILNYNIKYRLGRDTKSVRNDAFA